MIEKNKHKRIINIHKRLRKKETIFKEKMKKNDCMIKKREAVTRIIAQN